MTQKEVALGRIQEQFLRFLFSSKRDITDEEIIQRKEEIGLYQFCPSFIVAYISIDNLNKNFSRKDYYLERVEKRIIELVSCSSEYHGHCVMDEVENFYLIITSLNKNEEQKKMIRFFRMIRNDLKHHFRSEVYISVGNIVNDYCGIVNSAYTARKLLGYRYRYNDDGIITNASIIPYQHFSDMSNHVAFDRVIGCFLDGNLEKMEKRLIEFVETLTKRPNVSEMSVSRNLLEMVIHILNIASDSEIDVEDALKGRDPYYWILSQKKTESIIEWILQLSSRLLDMLGKKNISTVSERLKVVNELITNNVDNTSFGLSDIARALKLSESYTSRLIKKETGKGAAIYILEKRIERTKHFLSDTSVPIHDIAIQNGFSTANYFIRAFKNLEGITPGEYRMLHHKE